MKTVKALRERLIDVSMMSEAVANRLREDFERQRIEISDLTLKLALVEKEAADLK